MTINQALQWGIEQLNPVRSRARAKGASPFGTAGAATSNGVDSPELDAELFLTYALEKEKTSLRFDAIVPKREEEWRSVGRAWLYAHQEQKLTNAQFKAYQLFIKRRARREPVAYILGHKEFYGLGFLVNREVLIPRPETELLVNLTLNEMQNAECRMQNVCIVDVGTGSGAIVVALATKLKIRNQKPKIIATDISHKALGVARRNARRHGVEKMIKFLSGDLLNPVSRDFRGRGNRGTFLHIVVANLPYVSTSEYKKLQPEITKYEPRSAIDGGRDGLKYYCEMFKQLSVFIRNHSRLSALCLCEICPHQAGAFKKVIRKYFPKAKISVIKDLAGRNRVASVSFMCDRT